MLIKIDVREQNLINECNNLLNNYENITIEIVTLDIGDIILYDDNNNEIMIIERKTLNDLASSIKDGRYKEQGYRLSNCSLHNHNIFYLIEGNLSSYNNNNRFNRIDKKTLLSAFVSITYFKGFSLYRTNNLTETAECILSYANKIQKDKNQKCYYNNEKNNDIIPETYVNVCSRVKKNNITLDNIGAIMLSQIPGVSTNVAEKIMQEYKTIGNLIEHLKENQEILNTIKIGKDDKLRKISKTTILNINKFLIPEKIQEITITTE
jgi:crossover junction endonuclease MUS81